MARQVKRYGWVLGLGVAFAAAALSVLWPGARSEAALRDGGVRVLSNGPIALAPGDEAATRLLLPAVQRAMARVTILDGEGNVLFRKNYENPDPTQGATNSFFEGADLRLSLHACY
ncbi:MAG: hypothetical protein IT365_29250 [Candidatus Hydrogenedentes bacterium]|nr:hypothetical protein [Candidatus Hydrogenedentota bacterium]